MGSWIAKLADGWGSVVYEVLVLFFFIFPAMGLLMQELVTGPLVPIMPFDPPHRLRMFLGRRLAYDRKMVPLAAACVGIGLVFLGIELHSDFEIRIFNALAHCAFGASAYCIWRMLPCYDKTDDIPLFK